MLNVHCTKLDVFRKLRPLGHLNLSYNKFENNIFSTPGFKLEKLSRTLKRFEGVCPTNLLDFSELGTFGLANWQYDKVTTLKSTSTVESTQALKCVRKEGTIHLGA